MSGRRAWKWVSSGPWLGLAVFLCVFARPLAAQGGVVREGDRVRVWLGPSVLAPGGSAAPLEGKLLSIYADTVRLKTGLEYRQLPQASIARIERSIGRPHAWRNAGYAFAGTFAVGVGLLAGSGACKGGDWIMSSETCVLFSTVVLVLPASGVVALITGLTAGHEYEPARLPAADAARPTVTTGGGPSGAPAH